MRPEQGTALVGTEYLLGDIGWPVWLALSAVVFCATLLQVGAGVGFGSIAAPGTMLLVPQLVPGPVLCLSLVSSLLGMRRMQGKVAVREVAVALVGRTLGAAVAGWMIAKLGSRDGFALLFSGLTLCGVGISLCGPKVAATSPALLVAGFLSGLMATVTTIGGPPMALNYQHQPAEKARATMNAYFGLGVIPPVVALWLAGALDFQALMRAGLLLPAVVAGVAASGLATRFITRRYSTILLGFCIVAATIIAGRTLIGMLAR